jgi:hypothetical protein
LITVVANKADKLPGFEEINEVQLRASLKQALQEVKTKLFSARVFANPLTCCAD